MSAYSKENKDHNYVGSISVGSGDPSTGAGAGNKEQHQGRYPVAPSHSRTESSRHYQQRDHEQRPEDHDDEYNQDEPHYESVADPSSDYGQAMGEERSLPMNQSEMDIGGGARGNNRSHNFGELDEATSFVHRRALDDSSQGVARMMRVQQAETAIREDMFKEFTFHPKIKPLPKHYGAMKNQDPDFNARVTKWQKEKELEVAKRSSAKEHTDISQCTFKPKINRNSERAVQEIRGSSNDIQKEMVGERLHSTYHQQNEDRARLIEETRLQEEYEKSKECTFVPTLVAKKGIYAEVHSRYELETNPNKKSTEATGTKECTFTPQINRIRPSMASAKLYVSANVVDRLTRPIAVPNNNNSDISRDDSNLSKTFDNSDRPVMDVATFMSGGGNGSNGNYATPHQGNNGIMEGDGAGGGGGGMTEEERRERTKNFNQFMYRQEQTLQQKRDRRIQLENAMTPKFTPVINEKSSKVNKITMGTFMERMDRAVQKKTLNEQRSAIKTSTKGTSGEEDCTFKPKINKRSEQLAPRSTFEMSKGDYMKKETSKRMIKLQKDQEELAQMTFKPQMATQVSGHNTVSKNAQSRLQLSTTDTSEYISWTKEKFKSREEKALEEARKREEDELKECTFTPKTKECPAYVKRIASSLKVVKGAASRTGGASAEEANAKPEWK